MSTDFKKVSILDDRLMTTDSLNYGVFRGGQNVTNVRMPAISATNNSLNFVVPFPSESTILDREVYLRTETDYILQFNNLGGFEGIPIYAGVVAGNSAIVGYQCPLIYGYNVSIGSFPTQRSIDTMQIQINNNINTINTSDVLPALLRCSDVLDWEKNNMTASTVDNVAMNWESLQSGINNSMGAYDLSQGNKNIFNGAFTAEIYALVATSTTNTGLPSGPAVPYTASGAINVLARDGAGNPIYNATGTNNFLIRVVSTEPLVAPPFIWNKTQSNCQGIYGIQNLSVVANYGNLAKSIKLSFSNGIGVGNGVLASTAASSTPPPDVNIATYQIQTQVQQFGDNVFALFNNIRQEVRNAELQMKYLTPHGTDVKPLRNVIPLLEYPRFISSGYSNIPNATNGTQLPSVPGSNITSFGVQGLISPSTAVLASQTYTLNQVPDKLLIFVRPDARYRNSPFWNDWVFPIENINIQWNNHAGILANASQEQLFHMSKEAGSNQDYLAFSGVANGLASRFAGICSTDFTTIPIVQTTGTTPNQVQRVITAASQAYPQASQINTIGSYLMLDMAKHIELQEPFYAPGSLGSFQLQFNVTISNYQWVTPYGIGNEAGNVGPVPEIVVIPVNSGIMVTEKGQTSCYSGILTKSDVLDASLQEPYGHMEIKRIIGHGHQDRGKALPKKCHPQGRKDPLNKHQNMGMDHRLM
jgi:hypothetical protein